MKHLFILLFASLLTCLQLSYAQDVLIPTSTNNEFTFKPDNFPTFSQRSPRISSYRYFWNFGDGTFKLLDSANTNALSNVAVPQTHAYPIVPPGTRAKLEITQIYSPPAPPDDDVERAASPPFSFGSVTEPVTTIDVETHGGSLMIQPVREARPGFPVTFIITYDLDSCRSSTGEWAFIFYYNSFILQQALDDLGSPIAYVEGYNGETFYNLTAGSGVDKLEVNVNPTPPYTGRHSFFLHFDVSPDAEIGMPLKAWGTFGALSPAQPPPCDSFFLPDMHVGKSYDPNYKLVSKDTITTNPAQTLHYIIHFQNTGDGPTDSIRVEDFIDPRLNPSELRLTAVRIGYQHIPLSELVIFPDPAGLGSEIYPWKPAAPTPVFQLTELKPEATHYVWKFANAKLRGTKEDGLGETFSELETTGSIEFDIDTRFFEEYGIVIENAAHIYFDDNDVITTEAAETIKFCCDVLADSSKLQRFSLKDYVDTTRFTQIQSFHFSTDTLPRNDQPFTEVNTQLWICDYGASKTFEGLDILRLIVCDSLGNCDSVNIHICSNLDQKLAKYPCDTTSIDTTITSIFQAFSKEIFTIFPNPTTDKLWIESQQASHGLTRLLLYNAQGQLLRQKRLDHSTKASLNLAELPAGMYILHINDRWTQKIIKQ